MPTNNEVYLFDAVRTPRGKGKKGGALHSVRPIELARTILEALKNRQELETSKVEDVIFGCVTQVAEQGACIAKSAALYANYHHSVPGVTLNRFCGSGLEAINQAAARIGAGHHDLIIAGGVESMSRIAMGSDGGAMMTDPSVASKINFVPQGVSADLIATRRGYTRQELDKLAQSSHQKAAQAQNEKRFARSLIPVQDRNGQAILSYDETVRGDCELKSLSQLQPSFEKLGHQYGFDGVALQKYPELEKIQHVHHAGNSSGIADGASAVLMGNQKIADQMGLKPRAKIRSVGLTATEPTIMLTGPAPASQIALQKAGMQLSDIDLIEINEAFASVVLNFIDELKVDFDKVNVNGGSIAMGHPLGATGAMLVGTLLDELERRDQTTGLVTLCIGGGMGIATVIERV